MLAAPPAPDSVPNQLVPSEEYSVVIPEPVVALPARYVVFESRWSTDRVSYAVEPAALVSVIV